MVDTAITTGINNSVRSKKRLPRKLCYLNQDGVVPNNTFFTKQVEVMTDLFVGDVIKVVFVWEF